MKKPAIYFLILTSVIFFTSCKKSNPVPPVNTEVVIRVKNTTPWIFYNCTVNPYNVNYNYGEVKIDSLTAYKTFSEAYRYVRIVLTMNGKTYGITPFDYVGETPLVNGKYTYNLTYSAADDRLNIELIKD